MRRAMHVFGASAKKKRSRITALDGMNRQPAQGNAGGAAQLPSIVSPAKARLMKAVESGSDPFTVAEWSNAG